eukprot:9351186-Ditylum_brightwellii.AAC.1
MHTLTPAKLDLPIQTTIKQEESIPDEANIKETVGMYKGLMWPRTFATDQPAAPLLQNYAKQGCPMDCGPNLSHNQIIT